MLSKGGVNERKKKNDNDQVAQKHRHSVKRKKRRYQRNKSVVERLCRTDSFFFPQRTVLTRHTKHKHSHLFLICVCFLFRYSINAALHLWRSFCTPSTPAKWFEEQKQVRTLVFCVSSPALHKKKKDHCENTGKGKKVQNRIQNFPGASPNLHASSH